jgi:protein-arginine kinase activator protein McsA
LISTFLQDFEVDVLNKFVDKSNKGQLDYFQKKLEECIQNEEYESACRFRDLIKNKSIEEGQNI